MYKIILTAMKIRNMKDRKNSWDFHLKRTIVILFQMEYITSTAAGKVYRTENEI